MSYNYDREVILIIVKPEVYQFTTELKIRYLRIEKYH